MKLNKNNMNQKVNFPLVVILIILLGALLLVVGFKYNFSFQNKEVKEYGIIEGSLSYPSEFIPSDMEVCAEDIKTEELYCTSERIEDVKYTYGYGYKLKVLVGNYYVFATRTDRDNENAYYSEFVTCGLHIDCPSHDQIIVTVGVDQIVTNIDPGDWYAPYKEGQTEKEQGIDTSARETYRNKEGFSYKTGDSYLYTKEALKENGWVPIIPDSYNPIIKELPEISSCGSGVDAICTVDFKKIEGDIEYRNHLNLQSKNSIWIVVGSE